MRASLQVAPDLSPKDRRYIAKVALAEKVDGLIVSNTTIARPTSLNSPHAVESGGLSGAPLFDASTEILRDFYELTGGQLLLFGVGGVRSGRDAYAKIRAGASAVQLYSALAYEGPPLVGCIKRELAQLLEEDGFSCVAEAVGSACRAPRPGGKN